MRECRHSTSCSPALRINWQWEAWEQDSYLKIVPSFRAFLELCDQGQCFALGLFLEIQRLNHQWCQVICRMRKTKRSIWRNWHFAFLPLFVDKISSRKWYHPIHSPTFLLSSTTIQAPAHLCIMLHNHSSTSPNFVSCSSTIQAVPPLSCSTTIQAPVPPFCDYCTEWRNEDTSPGPDAHHSRCRFLWTWGCELGFHFGSKKKTEFLDISSKFRYFPGFLP